MMSLSWFVIVALVIAGCSGPTAVLPEVERVEVAASSNHAFIARLSGAEEVPPADTRARGQATFRLSADGQELAYRLVVANIENVAMAHIHLAPKGANGPVVAWLYPDVPPAQLIPGTSQVPTGEVRGQIR